MDTLAKRLTWALEETGLSQRALARAAGLASERHVGLLASGDRENPELKTLRAVAVALGVSVGWLADGDEPAPTAEELRITGEALKAAESSGSAA
ncbi:MAG TPA: helix-turn-helix domain-containing protein [Polyangiaceae bacterium]|nr:helix-turn-helix domain-containing protein [Polyangiaceae bacterium]